MSQFPLASGNPGNRSSIYVATIDKNDMETSLEMDCLSAEFRHRLGILPEEEQELSDIFKAKMGLSPLDKNRVIELVCQKKKTMQMYPIDQFSQKYFKNEAIQSVSYIHKQITSPILSMQNIIDTQASIYIFVAINKFMSSPDMPVTAVSRGKKQPYVPVMARIKVLMDSFYYGQQEKEDGTQSPKPDKTKRFSIKKIMQKTIGKAYSRKSSLTSPPTSSSSSGPFSSQKRKNPNNTYENLIGELKDQVELVQFIVSHAIMRNDLKDEIFCQLCCQASDHDNPQTNQRAWMLHALCSSCFLPSSYITPYYISYLHHSYNDLTKPAIDRIFQNILKTNDNGFRFHPPNSLELNSELSKTPPKARVEMVDGSIVTITILPSTTSMEACVLICQQVGIEDSFGFSLYLSIFERASSLGCGSDHIMDAITECEHLAKDRGMWTGSGWSNDSKSKNLIKNGSRSVSVVSGSSAENGGFEDGLGGSEGRWGRKRVNRETPWIMSFRKELFTPWYDPGLDPVASGLVFAQIKEGLAMDELKIPEPILATVLAQLLYVEEGAITDIYETEMSLRKFVSEKVLGEGNMLFKEVTDVAIRLSLDSNEVDKSQIRSNLLTSASKYFAMNFSALFEAYNYGDFPEMTQQDVILALNGKGVYILDSGLMYILAHFRFCDLLYANSISHNSYTSPILSLVAVDGMDYRLSSPNSEVVSKIVVAFLNGLKRRSSWAIATKSFVIQDFRTSKRFSTLDTINQSFELRRGDIIELSDEAGEDETDNTDFLCGRCERSGLKGFFPLDVAFVIPITSRPSQDYLEALKILSNERTDETQTLFKKSKIIMADADTIKKVVESSA